MSPGTSLAGFIEALECVPVEDVKKLFVAATCVLAIQGESDPRDILGCLGDALAGEWDDLREAILIRQFEAQMGAAAEAPI